MIIKNVNRCNPDCSQHQVNSTLYPRGGPRSKINQCILFIIEYVQTEDRSYRERKTVSTIHMQMF